MERTEAQVARELKQARYALFDALVDQVGEQPGLFDLDYAVKVYNALMGNVVEVVTVGQDPLPYGAV